MILRVPDYFGEFKCTAGWCKDSCCIGWEINIDEDTRDFYEGVAVGEIATRLQEVMCENEDGETSFRLGRNGRCPFLNSENLCDICIHMGEEALSEVCTEYPRFSLWYADVQQKCLSLSCEEVGRILFSREEPVEFTEVELPEVSVWEGEEVQEYGVDFGFSVELKHFLEQAQNEAIAILQNRALPIEERIQQYLSYLSLVQDKLNRTNPDAGESLAYTDEELAEDIPIETYRLLEPTFEQYVKRMDIFKELEVLDDEWVNVKQKLQEKLNANSYHEIFHAFKDSTSCLDMDYENLLVYFTFRYFMNAYYNMDVLSYGKLAVVFTLMIRDMDVVRFEENGGAFSRADRVETARIFSKEVEHSEENVEYVREEILFL